MITRAQWTPGKNEQEPTNGGVATYTVDVSLDSDVRSYPSVVLPFGHSIVPPGFATPIIPVRIGATDRAYNL